MEVDAMWLGLDYEICVIVLFNTSQTTLQNKYYYPHFQVQKARLSKIE